MVVGAVDGVVHRDVGVGRRAVEWLPFIPRLAPLSTKRQLGSAVVTGDGAVAVPKDGDGLTKTESLVYTGPNR